MLTNNEFHQIMVSQLLQNETLNFHKQIEQEKHSPMLTGTS